MTEDPSALAPFEPGQWVQHMTTLDIYQIVSVDGLWLRLQGEAGPIRPDLQGYYERIPSWMSSAV